MDNLTHTLTALALSQAGLNRKTRFATLALVVGANLPDLDLLSRWGGSLAYLKYHRGIAHSILGVTILAALLTGGLYYIARRFPTAKKAGPTLHPRWLLGICWIATASNLALDFTNSYGVRPFLPFSNRWYALAAETAQGVTLPSETQILVITAPAFVATKLEAFAGRGGGDYRYSHDLEAKVMQLAQLTNS